jgi:PAS domain-containing protein
MTFKARIAYWIVELRLVHDEQGNPIALCGISTDITEYKKIQKALAESEARYRQIVENTQEGIWIWIKILMLCLSTVSLVKCLVIPKKRYWV